MQLTSKKGAAHVHQSIEVLLEREFELGQHLLLAQAHNHSIAIVPTTLAIRCILLLLLMRAERKGRQDLNILLRGVNVAISQTERETDYLMRSVVRREVFLDFQHQRACDNRLMLDSERRVLQAKQSSRCTNERIPAHIVERL